MVINLLTPRASLKEDELLPLDGSTSQLYCSGVPDERDPSGQSSEWGGNEGWVKAQTGK